eukprot:8076602-Alexandrium_andersonii.AAC.1
MCACGLKDQLTGEQHLKPTGLLVGHPVCDASHVDMDGGFTRDFSDAAQAWGARSSLVAGQAPWQHGVAERHGGWWKETWKKMVEETGIDGDEE